MRERRCRTERMFLRAFAMAALVFVAGCGGDGAQRPTDDPGPWIEFEETFFDFGPMYAGQESKHEFRFKNRGKARLEIKDVKAECGCSKPEMSTLSLAPGESASMTVVFSPPAPTQLEKRIRIYSNDSYSKEVVVTLRCHGLGAASIEPTSLVFEGEVPPEGLHRRLQLTVRDGETIAAVTPLDEMAMPWFAIEVLGGLGTGRVEMDFHLLAPFEPINIRENLPVKVAIVSNGRQREIAVYLQVSGTARPIASASPPALHVVLGRGVSSFKRRVQIRVPKAWSGEPAVKTREEGFSATLERTGTDGAFDIEVHSAAQPTTRRVVHLSIEWDAERRIELPVLIAVEPGA